MLEELKKIKIAEIDEKISAIQKNSEPQKKYNWFERKLFKKKEYEAYLKERKEQSKQIKSQIEDLETQKSKYMYAVCIQQLDLDLISSIELLRKNGINEILTMKEMEEETYKLTKPDIDSLEGLILVHKTNYMPTRGRINSVEKAEVYTDAEYQIADQNIPVNIRNTRNTVHFAVNGEIRNHFEGNNWDDAQYAILIPFTDIPRDKYASVNANDTYTNGSVELTSNCWILVPQGEGKLARENNPGVNVIEYEGTRVTGFANKMVRLLGYHHQRIDPGSHGGWYDADCQKKFGRLITNEGFKTGIHYHSYEKYQEKFGITIQIIIQMMKYVELHPELLSNPEFVNQLQEFFFKRLNITSGKNKDICTDVYNYMLSESYILSEEKIMELSSAPEQERIDVRYQLAKEIIDILLKNYQYKLGRNQEIKK